MAENPVPPPGGSHDQEAESTAQAPVRRRSDVYFVTDDLHANLGRKTARGGAYTLASTGINFVVTTVSTVLITRELTDEDFGLFGMVMVLTGFASMFVDLGLSRAVIQKPKINHAQVSTLFWINLAVAAGLAGIVSAATPLLVWLYDEPRLAPINLALAGLFIVSALGLQHRALLTRRLEHGRLNLVSLLATPIAALVAVVVAFLGGKVWALVALPAVAQVANVLGMWIACPWVPGFPRRNSGVRTMLGFGAHVTGFQFINYFARNADNAMLGYAWGAGPLGLYTRAYSLMMLPSSRLSTPLTNVVNPMLSRLVDQPERFAKAYLAALGALVITLSPIIGWFAVTIDDLIPVFLGPQWAQATPIFLALMPACLMMSSGSAGGWLYMSVGHVHRQLQWVCIQVPATILAMAIGIQYGAIGVAVSVSVIYVSFKPFALAYASRGTPVLARDAIRVSFEPALVSAMASVVAMLISRAILNQRSVLATVASETLIFFLLWSFFQFSTRRGRAQVSQTLAFRQFFQ